MPPFVALFGGLFLTLVFLAVDIREDGFKSPTLLPTLWFGVQASRPIPAWLNPDAYEAGMLSGHPLDVGFEVVLIFCAIALVVNNPKAKQVASNNVTIAWLYVLFAVSSLWSIAPSVALKHFIRALGDVLIVLLLILDDNPKKTILQVFRRLSYILIPMSIVLIKYYRNLGVGFSYEGETMWKGVATHKNSLGQLVYISLVFLLWEIKNCNISGRRFRNALVAAMCIHLLLGAGPNSSKTSIGVCIICLIVWFFLGLFKNDRGSIATSILVAVAVFGLMVSAGLVGTIIEFSGRDTTLTGRTPLWGALIRIGSQNRLLGVGYGSFWIPQVQDRLWGTFRWRPTSAHNGYVDVYLQLGLVGLGLLMCLIVETYSKILATMKEDFDYFRLKMVLFVAILTYNITESSFFRAQALLWSVFLIVALRPTTTVDNPVSIGRAAVNDVNHIR